MPLLPRGLTPGLLTRVRERLKRELGLAPTKRPPVSGPEDVLLRMREAVHQEPPKLVRALYKGEDATSATWRLLEPYSIRYRGKGGVPLLYAACEKESYKGIEAFRLERFQDVQVTDIPFKPRWKVEL